jgi:quercetin dioxygenase-like cupin family protein
VCPSRLPDAAGFQKSRICGPNKSDWHGFPRVGFSLDLPVMETKSIDDLIRFSDEKMQKVPLFDSAKYFCDLYCLKPGQEQRIHTHEESDKIYFVLRGSGVFHVAGDERELRTGETVIARPGQNHGVRNAASVDLVLLVFMTPRP